MSKFLITQSRNNTFQYHLMTENGTTILNGLTYDSRRACERAIAAIRLYAESKANFEKQISIRGKFHFQLRNDHGNLIGISEAFETSYDREKVIASVKAAAPSAPIEYQKT